MSQRPFLPPLSFTSPVSFNLSQLGTSASSVFQRDFVAGAWNIPPPMKMIKAICALSLVLGLSAFGAEATNTNETGAAKSTPATATNEVAVLKTSEGEMVIEFWSDVAPGTVENFKKLAKAGFYDGTAFHRIIDGFMIQGGDPLTKDPAKESSWGTGGPGYQIKGETNRREDRNHVRGVISMANSGHPDTAGSQFFICLAPARNLDGGYTAFGKLIKGDDVLAKLAKTPVKPDRRGELSRPVQRVELLSVKIAPASSVK
jgi:peptidyl-prolyl cis-trans isomerase B (cyclophilin B)